MTLQLPFYSILDGFSAVTIPQTSPCKTTHKVHHHSVNKGPFPRCHRSQVDYYPRDVPQPGWNSKTLKLEIICSSSSPWASSLPHIIREGNGDWRPRDECSLFNNAIAPAPYLIPHIRDFSESLWSKRIFSKLDLVRACYNIPFVKCSDP